MVKNFIKKSTLLYPLFLLIGGHLDSLYATSLVQPVFEQEDLENYRKIPSLKRQLLIDGYCKIYNIPSDLCFLIRYLVYDNPFQYRHKPLPEDLSYRDLSGFDFTGCHFIGNDLTDTNLSHVTLKDTTCDYQKAFQENIIKNQREGGDWYINNLPNDFKNIAAVYVDLQDSYKARLLQIACGFSRLPFYKGEIFHIKVIYWASLLLQLKDELDRIGNSHAAEKLTCALDGHIEHHSIYYCWSSCKPTNENEIVLDHRSIVADFSKYVKKFTEGYNKYKCEQLSGSEPLWYRKIVIKSIEKLGKVYSKINHKKHQQEASLIAYELSRSYEFAGRKFLDHYIFWQNRLIRLEKLVKIKIFYKRALLSYDMMLGAWYE